MIKNFIDNIQNIEQPIIKLMFKGFKFSYWVCLFAIFILVLYITYPFSHIIYQAGLILFKTGLMFATYFFICALVTDKIKKEMA